jgi:hypothetical protein
MLTRADRREAWVWAVELRDAINRVSEAIVDARGRASKMIRRDKSRQHSQLRA